MKSQSQKEIEELEKTVRPIRKMLNNFVDAIWREYKKKNPSSQDFKNYLKDQIKKGMNL